MAKEQIKIFKETIEEQLLGPGSDVFAGEKEVEIIADFPLKRYYTGVLFPKKILNDQGEKDTEMADDSEDNLESVEVQNDNVAEQEGEQDAKERHRK